MTCFVGMLMALLKVSTVNLTELACGFSIDFPQVASWVIQFFSLTDKALYLSMDRTN